MCYNTHRAQQVEHRNNNCWCGSMAEQLICNQQVVGSTPITSSNTVCRLRTVQLGGIPEWPKGTDCKSAGTAFGGSNPPSPIRNAAMAQLVERVLGKDEVPGPNPGSSLKYLRIVLLHDTQFSFFGGCFANLEIKSSPPGEAGDAVLRGNTRKSFSNNNIEKSSRFRKKKVTAFLVQHMQCRYRFWKIICDRDAGRRSDRE